MSDKIKVFYTDDESLKTLGELLSHKTSRDIIRTLSEDEYYINELAGKLDLQVSLVIHHMKKLEEIGLVTIKEKVISKNTKKHRFFRIRSNIFISKSTKEDTEKKGMLSKIFKEGIKFASIIIPTATTFMITDFNRIYNPDTYAFDLPVLVFPLTVLCICLIFERIYSIKKRKINPNLWI